MKDKKRKSDWNKYLWLVGKKTLNPLKEAGIIALWYSVFGFTWIFLTDRILQWLVSDPDQYNQIQLAKGWLFVALTVVFIFWIVKARIEMIKTFVSDIISTTKALDQTEEELSLQRAYTAEIIRKAPVMIVVWNHEGRLIAANPYTMEVLGYTDVDQVLDKWETDIIAPQDREDLYRVFQTMQKDKRFLNHETALIKRNGEIANVIWNSGLLLMLNYDNLEEYISFGVDVTEKRKITDQIRKLAYHDSLTDLPNRSSLETTVTELLKRPKVKFALAYLDIDNFKYINDSLGHHIGDELLKHIATCLKKVIQPPHHVARLGGDEFALIIDHFTDESQVHILIDSLKEEIGKTWYILDHSFYISLSIGVAVAKDNGHDFNTLYKNADIAMYYAKKEGKNRLAFFMDHIETDSLYHIDMAKRIKRAIEE
ncbi:MAG: sensor domain-containing diguanylate cyclase, partial [Candidatus Izemoplasmatales bacterium]